MGTSDWSGARQVAEAAALSVGDYLREGLRHPGKISSKSDEPWNVVTEYDVTAEKRITELLAAFDPSIPVRGEELGGDVEAETTWLIDPIDGTGCFIRGLPEATTMIALIHQGQPVVGVINCFAVNELFSSSKGDGATCNGDRIQMADRSLEASYVNVEMNLEYAGNPEIYKQLYATTGVMNLMCCGYVYAMSACGRLDGRIAKDGWGSDWDYAPGSLLVAEAGGIVTNMGSGAYDYRNHDSLALAPGAYRQLTEGDAAIFPLA